MSDHPCDPGPEFDRVDRAIREAYAEVEAALRARIDAERVLAACSAAHDRAGQRWFALVQLRIDASDAALQELRSARPAEGV